MAAACENYARKGYTAQERYPNGNMGLRKPSGAERVELSHTLDGKVRAAEGPHKAQVIYEAPPPPLPPWNPATTRDTPPPPPRPTMTATRGPDLTPVLLGLVQLTV